MCMQQPHAASLWSTAITSFVSYVCIYTVTFHYVHFNSNMYKLLSVLICRYNMSLIVLLELTVMSYLRIGFQAGSTASTERRQKWRRGALKRRECHAYIGMRWNLGCNGRGNMAKRKRQELKNHTARWTAKWGDGSLHAIARSPSTCSSRHFQGSEEGR